MHYYCDADTYFAFVYVSMPIHYITPYKEVEGMASRLKMWGKIKSLYDPCLSYQVISRRLLSSIYRHHHQHYHKHYHHHYHHQTTIAQFTS